MKDIKSKKYKWIKIRIYYHIKLILNITYNKNKWSRK